jgi:ATP-dependent exoDNAse (exonuclease V) beta subunit
LTHQSMLADSEFGSTYGKEVRLSYLDSLNMLYVAFTRAEEVIWGLSDFTQSKKGEISPKRTGNLLYELFLNGFSGENLDSKQFWNPDSYTFDWGDWPEPKKDLVKKDFSITPMRWEYSDWKSKLKTRDYAWDFSEAGVSARNQRMLGVIVHEILEKAIDLEEGLNLVRQFGFEGRLDEETRSLVSSQLQELFELPEFKNWYSSAYQAMSEQGILLPGGSQKRPDRILIGKDKAVVVDFKTGEQKESHFSQVRDYMHLVSQLSQKPVEGYLCYLEPTQILAVHG